MNDDLYDFWFADAKEPRSAWFKKDPAFDREIASRFGARLDTSVGIRPTTPRQRLNLILLFDQVPRNAFRDTARAFAYDPRALTLAKEGLVAGDLGHMNVLETLFFLLPLEHAESLPEQDECVKQMDALATRAPQHLKDFAAEILEFARKHQRIIARFGRFPHRNAILGRESTPEEIEFLKQPGSRF